MNFEKIYCSYASYSVVYDIKQESLDLCFDNTSFLKNIVCKSKNAFISYQRKIMVNETILEIENKNVSYKIILSDKGITLKLYSNVDENMLGEFCLGENQIPINLYGKKKHLRAAHGNICSPEDNGIFDIDRDCAVYFKTRSNSRIVYDKILKKYNFVLDINDEISFQYISNVYADKYNINYSAINKQSTFPTPPVGWMTWYAVKFDACEKIVLENAKWQSENLKNYGANTIWVDWEWYHDSLTGIRNDGVNSLSYDQSRYPNGMKYVADKIKEMGMVPSLWIGFTNDPCLTEYTRKNPEIILTDEEKLWCGSYFYDFTHPRYLNEYLPMAVQQVNDWGYEAIKFDTLPDAINIQDKYRLKSFDSKITTKEAFRNVVKKVRSILGKDTYMLSCAALKDPDVLWASDIFDAARVGNDIFGWKEFIEEGVAKIVRYYPLHNKVFYCDPDNLILREEFNTFHQAESRIYLISLLGLPMTFGDVFSMLSEDRVCLIKKCLPVLDIRSCDLERIPFDNEFLSINLQISTDFDDYNVVGVFNLKDTGVKKTIEIDSIVNNKNQKYHIYDFTHEKYIGIKNGTGDLIAELEPFECKVLCIKEVFDIPQIVSTTRHFSQGAEEIKLCTFDGEIMKIICKIIDDENYDIIIYVPDRYIPDEQLEKVDRNLYKLKCKKEEYLLEMKINTK